MDETLRILKSHGVLSYGTIGSYTIRQGNDCLPSSDTTRHGNDCLNRCFSALCLQVPLHGDSTTPVDGVQPQALPVDFSLKPAGQWVPTYFRIGFLHVAWALISCTRKLARCEFMSASFEAGQRAMTSHKCCVVLTCPLSSPMGIMPHTKYQWVPSSTLG